MEKKAFKATVPDINSEEAMAALISRDDQLVVQKFRAPKPRPAYKQGRGGGTNNFRPSNPSNQQQLPPNFPNWNNPIWNLFKPPGMPNFGHPAWGYHPNN